MKKVAKLFARTKQTLKSEPEPPVVVSALPAPVLSTKPTGLEMFPELILVKDSLEKSTASGTSFLRRTSMLFESGRKKQNRLLFLVCSVFLGLVVFTQICAPLFSLSDQLQFTPLNPPQLAGEWMLNDVSDTPVTPHVMRIANVQQHNCDLSVKGTDELGDFEIVGKLTPPNKIHLVKIHDNPLLHDTQVMDGELNLESKPLYAHGSWTRSRAIDITKESLQAEGYWDANFYSTSAQPKFSREGILRSPEALMSYLRSGRMPEDDQQNRDQRAEDNP